MAELTTRLKAFAGYIRRPDTSDMPPGVEPRRMRLYRELFFNNIFNFLSDSFPVLKSCLPQDDWRRLVNGFYADHRCATPHFPEIPEEFLHYLQTLDSGQYPRPFLLELAHYEWVELALNCAEGDAAMFDGLQPDGNSRLALSGLALPLAYNYPVHQISREFQPSEPLQTPACLVVYRGGDEQVRFLEINPVTLRLLSLLREQGSMRLDDLICQLAAEMQATDRSALQKHAMPVLRDLLQRGVLLLRD